jgi:hypothetical protein
MLSRAATAPAPVAATMPAAVAGASVNVTWQTLTEPTEAAKRQFAEMLADTVADEMGKM